MTAGLAPAGWYADPTGVGRRWWNGHEWTHDHLEPLPDGVRSEILQAAIAREIQAGARVESMSEFQAVVVVGRNINHVAHLLGVLLTCGVWAIGWLIAIAGEKREHRIVLRVDPYGCVIRG